jgi:Zn-dependent M16 (insulinase) family peptidase
MIEERHRLDAVRARMSGGEVQALVDSSRTLKGVQETPDPPEAVSTIPSLTLRDLPPGNKLIPRVVTSCANTRVVFHEQPTNGIIYLDVGFSLHGLSADLLPYVQLFGRALLETGAGGLDVVEVSQRIGRATGGIVPRLWVSAIPGTGTAAAWMFLSTKSVLDRTDELLSIVFDALSQARLDNRERLHQLVLEEKSQFESRLPSMGNGYATLRLQSRLHEAGWASELMAGVSYLVFLRGLSDAISSDWERIHAILEQIRWMLVRRGAMICNVTTDAANWRRFEPRLTEFLDRLPDDASPATQWEITPRPRMEGLTIPTTVNCVVKGVDLRRLGHIPNGATAVVQHYLNTTWLWSRVRVQGSALVASCAADHRSGVLTFASYRDPQILETLDTFDQTSAYLREIDISEAELNRTIIGVIGQMDRYMLPDMRGFISLQRYLAGETDESLQRYRDEILSASPADVRAFGERLAGLTAMGSVVVIGSASAIDGVNAERPGFLQVTTLL